MSLFCDSFSIYSQAPFSYNALTRKRYMITVMPSYPDPKFSLAMAFSQLVLQNYGAIDENGQEGFPDFWCLVEIRA